MIKKIIYLLTILLLTGCHHLTITGFDKSPYSAVSKNEVGLIVAHDANNWPKEIPLNNYIKNNPKLGKVIEQTCGVSGEKFAPELIPVAAALGKMIFDLQVDKNTKELKKLKKAAVSSYSQRIFLSSTEFRKNTCAVLYRYDPKDNSIGFVSVLKLNNHKEAFTLSPTFIQANNTVAITKKPTSKKQSAKINASIAVSIKAVGNEKNGLPSLHSIGEGVITVPNIELAPNSKVSCLHDCGSSDLIPYMLQDNRPISVTFSVTETGKLGVDLDEKISELKAIKEAMGPALKEAIQEYLKEDD